MEPRQEEQQAVKPAESERSEKKARFHIVKLEERIAPAKGGGTNRPHPCATVGCYTGGCY